MATNSSDETPNGIMPFIDYEALLGYSNFDRHRVTAGIRFEL